MATGGGSVTNERPPAARGAREEDVFWRAFLREIRPVIFINELDGTLA